MTSAGINLSAEPVDQAKLKACILDMASSLLQTNVMPLAVIGLLPDSRLTVMTPGGGAVTKELLNAAFKAMREAGLL